MILLSSSVRQAFSDLNIDLIVSLFVTDFVCYFSGLPVRSLGLPDRLIITDVALKFIEGLCANDITAIML